jgi:4-hydroxyacetophenone monooxygenase
MSNTFPSSSSAGIGGYDKVEPIVASDAEIENHVQQADLPALLAALAVLTGDERLLAEDLRPPHQVMGASIKPQGGMSEEAQAKARELAVQALISFRDQGPMQGFPDEAWMEKAMGFIARDAGRDYLPLLQHELGLPRDLGAPAWTKQDVAPGRDFKVAVLGAGLSGVAAACRLEQAGVDYTVFEKNGGVGGVWWSNVYPGCRLDTPNFAYSYSFAQKGDWPDQFSRQTEIQKYVAHVANSANVQDRVRFNTEVISLAYDEPSARWKLTARYDDGSVREHWFNAIITAVGQLSRPAWPDVPGLESFGGRLIHSSEWPEDMDVKGKRVAVVGTGASAYQIVPAVVDEVKELLVFQRNPPWMLPTPSYHDAILPGMAWLLKHVPYYGRWFRFWQFWIAAEGRLPLVEVDPEWQHPVSVSGPNERLRLECMAHLEGQFEGRPDLLAKSTPTYPPGSKRMLRDNGVWASALKQPHTRLITDHIQSINPGGIVTADGQEYPVDVIVMATGFTASDYLAPIEITGRDGKNLHEWWNGDCRAYQGIVVPGFPNLFMTGGPNTGVVVNGSSIFSAECAVEYALHAIGLMLSDGYAAMEVETAPFEAFNDMVDKGNLTKAWGVPRAHSWYKNKFGRASQTWPFTLLEYWQLTSAVKRQDFRFEQADDSSVADAASAGARA